MGAKRGCVLFIVEGPTDELALGGILTAVTAQRFGDNVKFDVMRTDPLTRYRFTSIPNGAPVSCVAREKVRDEVLAYLERQRYAWRDLSRIVYLTDTDGVFIPDELVVSNEDSDSLVYGEDSIRCCDPLDIRRRNHMKAEGLNQLRRVGELTYKRHAVPFSVHYMSRNLEHALNGVSENQTDEEKGELARQFSRRYSADISGFLDLIQSLCPRGGYSDSWDYISRELHSLQRGTNLLYALEP